MTNAAATPLTRQTKTAFIIVKDRQEYDRQVQQLTHIAWQISYTALWNGKEFSAVEIAAAKEFIKGFIQQGSPLKSYSAFVQRVMLARQYIITHHGTYVPFPSRWFNTGNKRGFAGTEKWYRCVEEARAKEPAFKQYIKALPEAVLEIIEGNSAKDFHYWRSWFAERGAHSTLSLYLAVLGNCRYC
jgi:hypothetical protein